MSAELHHKGGPCRSQAVANEDRELQRQIRRNAYKAVETRAPHAKLSDMDNSISSRWICVKIAKPPLFFRHALYDFCRRLLSAIENSQSAILKPLKSDQINDVQEGFSTPTPQPNNDNGDLSLVASAATLVSLSLLPIADPSSRKMNGGENADAQVYRLGGPKSKNSSLRKCGCSGLRNPHRVLETQDSVITFSPTPQALRRANPLQKPSRAN
ncbi:hypothetical protein L484_021229 [Morus notabilis]|uniref:Uncharacterized protein n=1 Tax=Morus notabilis TaxID=981085 RepID=W9RT65_9ROSA|nr:hypothetical protein L484_021229 [Morus notabilis]